MAIVPPDDSAIARSGETTANAALRFALKEVKKVRGWAMLSTRASLAFDSKALP
jgi:hypothetical protein